MVERGGHTFCGHWKFAGGSSSSLKRDRWDRWRTTRVLSGEPSSSMPYEIQSRLPSSAARLAAFSETGVSHLKKHAWSDSECCFVAVFKLRGLPLCSHMHPLTA